MDPFDDTVNLCRKLISELGTRLSRSPGGKNTPAIEGFRITPETESEAMPMPSAMDRHIYQEGASQQFAIPKVRCCDLCRG
jgi:hypothetical protein